jgi:hypothetical protein
LKSYVIECNPTCMTPTLESTNVRSRESASMCRFFSLKGIARALRLTFVSGPWLLLTGQLSIKNASFMIMLCTPALLLWALLTIPPLLFPFPEHNAYYQFAQIVTADPAQWLLLPLTIACLVLALAIPATSPCPLKAD